MLEFVGNTFGLITYLIASLDYLGVGLLLVVLAPELVLPFAGFLVARERLEFIGVLAAATSGALLGQLFFYGLARAFGEGRVRRFLKRYGRFFLLREADLDQILALFKRYDASTLIFARFVPTLRTLVSLPAGFVGMRLWRFILLTTLGTLVWNAGLVGAGMLLERNWRALLPYVNVYGWVVLCAVLGGVVWLLWRRRHVSKSMA